MNDLLERVGDSSRNQQRFLANATHQLRTPLAGLRAHAELALAQPVPEACRAELEQVRDATIRTARLANQLLALSYAEPGGSRGDTFRAVDLMPLVEEAADEWVHHALRREQDLGFELAPVSVNGDAFLLREAFANLVHNSLEYTPAGGRVTVRAGTRPAPSGAHPYFEVEDDGPGIPSAERARVLERFYRTPGTPGGGSGLGLAIVNEIAMLHGARVELADGQGGRGCRIGLIFPAQSPAAA